MIPHKLKDKKTPNECTVCGALRGADGNFCIPRTPGFQPIRCSEDCDEARREIGNYHVYGKMPERYPKTFPLMRAFNARRETVSVLQDENLLKKLDDQFTQVREEAFDEAMAALRFMRESVEDKFDSNTLGCALAILDTVKAGQYIGPCVTPTGRTDGHMAYVRVDANGNTICMFCKKGK